MICTVEKRNTKKKLNASSVDTDRVTEEMAAE